METLVLSGNSTNALTTLGSLQRLFDTKILIKSELNSYYGTSSGSMICTLLSIGFEPIEVLAHICANKCFSKVAGINFTNGGILNFNLIETELNSIIITKLGYIPTLKCIKDKFGKSLTFVTFNMTKGIKEYLSFDTYPDLLVTKAIRMSSSFPFVFEPYKYDENYYIDGGITENFPMMTAQLTGKKCFGMYNDNPIKPYSPQVSYFELFFRLMSVFVSSAADNIPVLPGCKILKLSYEPSFFNFNSNNSELIKMFDHGYDICSAYINPNN